MPLEKRGDPFYIVACAVSNADFSDFVRVTGYKTETEDRLVHIKQSLASQLDEWMECARDPLLSGKVPLKMTPN